MICTLWMRSWLLVSECNVHVRTIHEFEGYVFRVEIGIELSVFKSEILFGDASYRSFAGFEFYLRWFELNLMQGFLELSVF